MASLKLSHIYKVYDNGHKAVNDFNIDIADKEFIVFVGPSGCGKSTTLRMIAGLETITAGDLFIGDTLVNDMEPKDRDIAMVFQSYALYPHMTVYENMAFGLRNRKMPEDQIKERVLKAAKMLDIEEYLDRKPKAMSGGQRQRVALGRALVRDPKVFLLDEPLSNLDAKLRAQMRTEITKLHKSLGTTFIYVTHDQVEAMTMGTRIVVMKLGYVQQIDTPMNLYNEPYNKFVAGFIGSPQMNFFNVKLTRKADKVKVDFVSDENASINLPYEKLAKIHDKYLHGDTEVIFGIRPEHLEVVKKGKGLKVVVNAVEHLGNECIVYGKLGDKVEEFSMKDDGRDVIVKTIEGTPVEVGDVIEVAPKQDKVHFFDAQTEITLMEKIPSFNSVAAKVSKNSLEVFGGKAKLPEVFAKALEGKTNVTLEIPPSSIVKGKDFTLPVEKCEEVDGKVLAYLVNGDSILFAIVDKVLEPGSEYSFSLLNEKVTVLADGEEVLKATSDKVEFHGTFSKAEVKENRQRVLHFFYNINGKAFEAPVEKGYKINTIDGNACYKNEYKYAVAIDSLKIVDGDEGLLGQVEEVLKYGDVTFAKVKVGSDEILVKVSDDFAASEVRINFASEDVEVYSTNIDMKIC
jgi:multiple sugar transport system ATP-binding protein